MNSRDRVMTALAFEEPDRVPLDYVGEAETTEALCRYYIAPDQESLLRTIGIDLRWIALPMTDGFPRTLPSGELEERLRFRRVTRIRAHTGYLSFSPLAQAETLADLQAHPWPDPTAVDTSELIRRCDKVGDYARLLNMTQCRMFFDAVDLLGMDKFMIWLVERPELVHWLMERLTDYSEKLCEKVFPAAREQVDMVRMVSDFGSQRSLLISPAMWREFAKPYFARVYQVARANDVKVFMHSDGAIRDIIPDLVEIGMDILNPIQVMAVGMDPAGLKQEFGDKMTFHGAIDVQNTLSFGSPEDVRNEVIDRINVLGPGGGFILCCSHSLLPEFPTENIVTMYKTALKYGRYPLSAQPIATNGAKSHLSN